MWGVKVNPDVHRFDAVSKASSVTTIADYDKNIITTVLEESTSSSFRRLCKHWKMFLVIIFPISAMLILSAFSLSRASDTLSVTSRALNSIKESVEFVTLVRNLQQERGLSTSFLGTSSVSWAPILNNIEKLQERTDTSLNKVNWPQNGIFILDRHWKLSEVLLSLSAHRDSVKNRTITILINLDYYTMLTNSLMKYITQSVAIPDDSQVQRLVVASGALLSWTDSAGIKRALGTIFFSGCGWLSNDIENRYVILHGKAAAQLENAIHFSSNLETRLHEIKMTFPNVSDFITNMESYQLFKNYISYCPLLTNEEQANKSSLWFYNMTYYIDTVFRLHGEIDVDVSTKLEALHSDSQFEFSLFLSTLLVVIIVSGIMSTWYLYCIAQLTGNLSKYAKKVQLKSEELAKEKKKTDNLLYQMLPKKIAVNLKLGKSSPAEHFSQVTIYFSDIIGFTTIGAQSEPIQIVNMLNDLYSLFDQCIDKYDVYKVETIGDAYMVASGVPTPNGSEHAPEIAMMALRIRHDVRNYTVPHMPGKELQIRIGIHTGSCVAGVVGTKMPRYCLFGDTVNTASRMESNGLGGKIHISNTTHALLCAHGNFLTEFRGVIDIKGKGPMATYWLERLKIEESEALVTLHV